MKVSSVRVLRAAMIFGFAALAGTVRVQAADPAGPTRSASPVQTGPASAAQTPPAQPRTPIAAPPVGEPPHELTQEDLATFFDGVVPYAIQRGNIAGGVLVVVKDGAVAFAKGYGYADVSRHTPLSPDQTLFRPGSVSKLFTWTAVMQLVAAGKLDLDRDVNDYLDFKIPPKFDRPITLRNLLTHTPGFEEGISEAFVEKPEQLYPLRDYLIKHKPNRIYPPGKIVAYSNYGASLAGYVVQRTSGMPFAEYVEERIFKPLKMEHSTFVQPLPAQFQSHMAQGYLTASDDKPQPFELIETAPAGAMSATGADLAHFMIAHLQDGIFEGASILPPETARMMHSPQSVMAPGLNGYCLGFYQENRNGLRIIGHAGDTEPFHSDLHLLLDRNIGVFMSFNSLGTDGEIEKVREQVFRRFLDRYFPYTPPDEKTVADPKPDAARVAGWYEASRRIDSALRLLSALGQSSVTARDDGTIEVSMLKNLAGTPKRWREVGPLTYREVDGQTHLKFVADASGGIAYWLSDDFLPVQLAQRVHGLRQLSALKVLAIGTVTVLVLALVIWVGGAIVRRHFRTVLELAPQQRKLRLASRIGVCIVLAMFAGWAGLFVLLTSGNAAIDGWLIALYIVGVAAALGAVAILVEGVPRVLHGPGGWLVRTGESVLILAAIYLLWFIAEYGLANFSLRY